MAAKSDSPFLAASIDANDPSHGRRIAINLFLVGFLVLFLELAWIRFLAAYVVFIQFFTNVVLIASFLGLSCGCLTARSRRNWLGYFPFIALGTSVAALAVLAAFRYWNVLRIEVGGQASPQEVFFGTGYSGSDLEQFVVPIEIVAAVFFVLVALSFVGLGQILGRALDDYPDRVRAYTLNIAGSIAGIVLFSAVSFWQLPPAVWYVIACCGVAYLLRQAGILTRLRALALIALVVATGVPIDGLHPVIATRWSPYYMVLRNKHTGSIFANATLHQTMSSITKAPPIYSLIDLLRAQSGRDSFRDVLVIGAGTGNDVAHALHYGAQRVDAVEIDPVIYDIGRRFHPDHPYDDARVAPHLDDGRHFLRVTDHKYDLVAYALVDSLILHSGYANIRLESYLFTEEAFADVQRALKPDGVFVMYNFFRWGWIVERVAAMAEKAFGCPPVVLSIPYQDSVTPSSPTQFSIIIAGCGNGIADMFRNNGSFWLGRPAPETSDPGDYVLTPRDSQTRPTVDQFQIAPSTLVHENANVIASSDDWPFLYVRGRLIPDLTIRSTVLLGVLGIGMVYLFLPKRRIAIHNRMFFLGAAFMLLETKAVVQMALLFGSTWLVNSLVFLTVLVLILFANVYVVRVWTINVYRQYLGLFSTLILGMLFPVDAFLDGGILWRYGVPGTLVLAPVFFAGVIFAKSFREAPDPNQAFGSNIAGSVVGGLSESASLILGFRYLPILAIAYYLLSLWSPRLQQAKVR